METKTCKRCGQGFFFSEDLKDGVCHSCRESEARQQREIQERIRAARLFEQVFDHTTDDTVPAL